MLYNMILSITYLDFQSSEECIGFYIGIIWFVLFFFQIVFISPSTYNFSTRNLALIEKGRTVFGTFVDRVCVVWFYDLFSKV